MDAEILMELAIGAAIAIAFLAVTFALIWIIARFHRALNVYRGVGLFAVIALLAGAVVVLFQSLFDQPPWERIAGTGSGLALGAFAAMMRARTYVPPAMAPPPPPPQMESPPDTDPDVLNADPFG